MIENKIDEELKKSLIEKGVLERGERRKLKLSENTYADVFVCVMGLSITFNKSSPDEILKVCSKRIDENTGYAVLRQTTSYERLTERVKEFQEQTKMVP